MLLNIFILLYLIYLLSLLKNCTVTGGKIQQSHSRSPYISNSKSFLSKVIQKLSPEPVGMM